MVSAEANPTVSVERFFQISLLGLVASGYLAVAGSGYLDAATIILTAAGLLLRGLLICGLLRLEITERASTLITLGYTAFYLLDYFVLSREFLQATVHLVFFLAVMKILTAKSTRDHLYTAVIAFLELLAAAILSVNFSFFVSLAFYLLFAIAALTSGEIRRSMYRARTARTGLKYFHPRLAFLSGMIALGILGLTAGMFFLLPRTAEVAFARLIPRRFHLPGFSGQVTLGEIGEIKTTSRPVMHIRVYGDFPGGLKWRGGALIDFDGKRWSNSHPVREAIVLRRGEADLVPAGEWPPGPRRLNYAVDFEELETDALFFAGTPVTVRLHSSTLFRKEGGAYQLGHSPGQGFHYEAYSVLEGVPETSRAPVPVPVLPLAARERYLQLPPLDPRIAELARATAAGAATDLARVRAIERRLRTDYGYTLELPGREVPDPLAYFLFTRKKGHCEYFAAGMTVMLRAIGVPARVATGFQSGVYNSITGLWLVRASDAHTWVEAWIPGHGWTTFDPTPPDPDPQPFSLLSRLALYLDAAETFWRQWVVGYNALQQGSLADRMEQGARRTGIRWFDSLAVLQSNWSLRLAPVWNFGLRWGIVLVAAACLWLLGPRLFRLLRMRRRVQAARLGRASVADATLLYQRMLQILKRHGYQKPAWFTPAEFAASIPPGSLGTVVSEFTSAYNALRFGGRIEVAPRLSLLLDELSRGAS